MLKISSLLLLLLWSVKESKSESRVYPEIGTEDDASSGEDAIPCCTSGNYSFYSIVNGGYHVTNNTIITIPTDFMLSSNVILENVHLQ